MAVGLLKTLASGLWVSRGTKDPLAHARQNAIRAKVGDIEKELNARWGGGALTGNNGDKESGAVTASALWNIVAPARGMVALAETKAMIGAITAKLSVRVIVLSRSESSMSSEIRSSTARTVVRSPNGARLACSDEITLTGPGRSEEDFGPLVLALQIPHVPTATFWIESPVMGGVVTKALLPLSHLFVVDTGRYEHPDELAALHRLTTCSGAELSDLGWLRLSGFRMLLAEFLKARKGRQPLRDTRITIAHRPCNAASALLLGAGLAHELGGTPTDARTSHEGRLFFTFATGSPNANRARIELDLCPSQGEWGPSGIISIEMRSIAKRLKIDSGASVAASETQGEQDCSLRYSHDNHAEICLPGALPRSVKLKSPTDAELWVSALGPGGRDLQLAGALATAAWLADRLARRDTR